MLSRCFLVVFPAFPRPSQSLIFGALPFLFYSCFPAAAAGLVSPSGRAAGLVSEIHFLPAVQVARCEGAGLVDRERRPCRGAGVLPGAGVRSAAAGKGFILALERSRAKTAVCTSFGRSFAVGQISGHCRRFSRHRSAGPCGGFFSSSKWGNRCGPAALFNLVERRPFFIRSANCANPFL